MKTTELRIGNYVEHNQRGITDIGMLSAVLNLVSFKPIPLTEEWLMNFGFELINNDYWQSRSLELKLHWTVNKNKMIPEFNDKRLIVGYDFKHVHQLQNLYFALTSQELKIAER
jgi:hypothetical protein